MIGALLASFTWRQIVVMNAAPGALMSLLILAYLGTQPPSAVGERVSQVGTLFYFGFFLLMPWWSRIGEPKPVPARVNFTAH